MDATLKKMQANYEELTVKLSEATVHPEEIDKQPGLGLCAIPNVIFHAL